jgi:glutamyl-tRNA synthetase
MTLGNALQHRTYLVGHCMTLADLALFAAAGFPTIQQTLEKVLSRLPEHAHVAARWLRMMASHPALQEATQLCCGISHHAEADFGHLSLDALVPGMNPLEGAVAGRVVTRFPPEPSGYLVSHVIIVITRIVLYCGLFLFVTYPV